MTTKAIGIKEFRKNITCLWKDAKKNNIKYIAMYHAKPILEVNPISETDFGLEKYVNDIAEARKQATEGKLIPQEKVFKKLGLI